MLTTYRKGWHRIYPVIMPLLRACQKTRCVGHRTMRTNRRWGGLSTRGGFGRLARTLLLYVRHVSHTGLAHKGDHRTAHLGTGLYMRGGWRQWRRCYRLRPRGMMHWSSAYDNPRPSTPLWEYHMWAQVLSSLHLQMEVVHRLLVVLLQVWLILCKLLFLIVLITCLNLHIITIFFNCFHYLQVMRQRLVRCRLLDDSWANTPPSGHHCPLHHPSRSNRPLASTRLLRELVIRKDGLQICRYSV
jgi:hypothetical protein